MEDDCLHVLEVIGKILLFTPIIVALPSLLYAILTGTNVSIGDNSAGYSAGLMMSAGFFILIYVSYKIIRKDPCPTKYQLFFIRKEIKS